MFTKDVCAMVVGGVGIILGTIGIFKSRKVSKKLDKINNAIDDVADDIDVTVPEDVVKLAMHRAADNACTKVAEKATNTICEDISKRVSNSINKAYSNIEGDLKKTLEEKINLVTLDRIEEGVIEDVSKQVLQRFVSMPGRSGNVSDIIRACHEAGFASYEIREVLNKMNRN